MMMSECVPLVRFCVDKPLIILHHLLVPLVGFPALMITRHHRTFILMANLYTIIQSILHCHKGI